MLARQGPFLSNPDGRQSEAGQRLVKPLRHDRTQKAAASMKNILSEHSNNARRTDGRNPGFAQAQQQHMPRRPPQESMQNQARGTRA